MLNKCHDSRTDPFTLLTFDAFGIQISSSGSTPNNYLYTGQQWDSDLGMYYLRARYYNQKEGRFWTMDTFEGEQEDPASVHKYLYCRADPANRVDPTGEDDLNLVLGAADSFASFFSHYEISVPVGAGTGGPDVTDALNLTLTDVEQTWKSPSFGWTKKWDNAMRLRDLRNSYRRRGGGGGAEAFDIGPLYRVGHTEQDEIDGKQTGTGAFQWTVAFQKNCYYANAVNYALWGKACRLSHDFLAADSVWSIRYQARNYTLQEAVKIAREFKHVAYSDYGLATPEAEAFTRYGYNGTPIPLSARLPCKWSGKTVTAKALPWQWLPHLPYSR